MRRNKFLATFVAAAVAVTTFAGVPSSALAAGCWTAPTSPIAIDENTTDANGNATNSIITAAGHRAAQTLVEIVGLDNKAAQNMAGNKDGIVDGDADQLDPAYNITTNGGLYDTVTEAGDNCKILGIFGSDLNTNPDPYYYNYYYNLYATDNNLTLVDPKDTVLMIASSLSPNVADTLNVDAYGGVSASVYSKADILVGATTKASQNANQTYPDYITNLYDSSDEYDDYNPVVFAYKYTDVYQEGESLQRLAQTMNNLATLNGSIKTDEVNTAKGTTGRYGDPMTTANDYQLYVKGLSAYVAEQLAESDTVQKSVVVIDPASSTLGQEGDSNMPGTGWFRAYDNTTKDGLATRTRGAECVENVTTNLLQTYKTDSSKVYTYNDTSDGTAYAISEDVVKEADVIIIQGAQSKIDVFTEAQFKNYMKTNYNWTDEDFASKTIIAENPQCVYGLTCNSSETAMGYGFYMGYIYPEILDPVDAIAFFYKTCLHVTDDSLQSFMDTNVATSVANLKFSDGSDNSSTKLSDGWYETIRSQIIEGVNYFNSLSADDQAAFKFVSRVATGNDVKTGIFTEYDEAHNNSIAKDLTDAKATLEETSYIYTGEAITPSVTVVDAFGNTLTQDTDYTVAYSDNTNVGTAKATITGAGSYTGTVELTFTIAKKAITDGKAALAKTSYTYTGKAITPSVTVKDAAGKTLTKNTDYTVKYSANTNAGTAKVTITGIGNYSGTKNLTFTIAKASQTISVTTTKTVKASALKKAAKKIKIAAKAKGTISYKTVSSNKKLSQKSGVITVKKGTKKGTYKIKVKITAKSTTNYNATSKTKTIYVKVK